MAPIDRFSFLFKHVQTLSSWMECSVIGQINPIMLKNMKKTSNLKTINHMANVFTMARKEKILENFNSNNNLISTTFKSTTWNSSGIGTNYLFYSTPRHLSSNVRTFSTNIGTKFYCLSFNKNRQQFFHKNLVHFCNKRNKMSDEAAKAQTATDDGQETVFGKMLKGKIPCKFIYEDDLVS